MNAINIPERHMTTNELILLLEIHKGRGLKEMSGSSYENECLMRLDHAGLIRKNSNSTISDYPFLTTSAGSKAVDDVLDKAGMWI